MIYIDFLNKNFFDLNYYYYNLLLKKINFNFLYKLGFFKKKTKILKIKKNIAKIKTCLNYKIINYENFKR